jgi:hypothetical protein
MTEVETLQAALSKVDEQIDGLSDARKTEVKRRYMVLYETILCLHAVEKRQELFLQASAKAGKTERVNTFIAIAVVIGLLWLKDDSNSVATYIGILGIAVTTWGQKLFSDLNVEIKVNQFWFENNRLKSELSSLTYGSTHLTRELIEIQKKYESENPNYEELGAQQLQWQIDAKKELIQYV